ncbi:MAG: DUF1629 domain-containing protein [Methylophilaceae bacterium]
MTWGLVNQTNFGQCFLQGSFIHCKDNIGKIFNGTMGGEHTEAYESSFSEYFIDVISKFIDDPEKIAEKEYPTDFYVMSLQKKFGSLLELENRIIAVDTDLKTLIERLEPNTHRFWPINIYLKTGNKTEKDYFGFAISHFIDSFKPKKSSGFYTKTNGRSYFAEDNTMKVYKNLCIDSSVVGGRSIWREKKLSSPRILISDQLCNEIKKQNLKIFKHYKMDSI